jgi:adenine deaminase
MSATAHNPLTIENMNSIRNVALGKIPADRILLNGNVVDVYSGNIMEKCSVAIKDDWIASIGEDLSRCTGPDTEIIDVAGKFLIPGFIDGHAHLAYYCSAYEALRYIMRGGTTTIITELVECVYVMGYLGAIRFMESAKDQPIKVLSTVPIPLLLSKSGYEIIPDVKKLKKLLNRDDVVGVGESYWQMVLDEKTQLPQMALESLRLRKTVEGHSAGARGEKLDAYMAYGISSCHEPTTVDEVLERLKVGLYVMIREGSIRRELDGVAGIKDMDINFNRIGLVTDGTDPRDLIKTGYMEYALQRAINYGFDPIKAIQMASINTAVHFHLDSYVGGIAPAKHADIVIIPDLQTIRPEYVFSKGKLIARDKELLVQPRNYNFPTGGLKKLNKHVKAEDFKIKTNHDGKTSVRVIDQITDLITREAIIDMQAVHGEIKADTSQDIVKLSLITWRGDIANCFVRGFKLKKGAIASSNAWEVFGILVIGTNDEDMAIAVNRLTSFGGGIVVYADDEVKAELPLPLGGLITSMPLEETADRLDNIQEKAGELGIEYSDLPRTMAVLTSGAIPFLRISEEGLFDIKNNQTVNLIVD